MKKLGLLLLIVSVLLIGISCSKTKCDECGSTKDVKEVTFMGAKSNLCADCREELKTMERILNVF